MYKDKIDTSTTIIVIHVKNSSYIGSVTEKCIYTLINLKIIIYSSKKKPKYFKNREYFLKL